MARVAALVTDLMLASRVETSLRAAGNEVAMGAGPGDVAADAELIVADLDAVDAEAVGALPQPSIGFYSHTDVETRRRAEAAGFDLVIPRSRMARELPELAERLLAG